MNSRTHPALLCSLSLQPLSSNLVPGSVPVRGYGGDGAPALRSSYSGGREGTIPAEDRPSPGEGGRGCILLALGKLSGQSAIECSPQGLWAPDVSFWHRQDLDEPHNWLLGRGHWQTQTYSGLFAYHLHLSAYAVAQPGLLCI